MINLKLLRYLISHPLNRRTRFRSISNILRWKIATSLLPKCQIIIPFANKAQIIITPGRWGSEANALLGLHDFNDMGFLLHLLRPTDIFCDVGANIGSYTVLASAAIGAKSISFEPIENSYIEFKKNIDINQITELVEAHHMAIGSTPGRLTLTSQKDTQNHVIVNEISSSIETIVVDTLDHVLNGHTPLLMKVDVEGWEQPVFQGALSTLSDPRLMAIIVELNQSGSRYGFSDDSINELLLENTFHPYRYQAFDRKLIKLDQFNAGGNTLYIRNSEFIHERLCNAPPFMVRGLYI